MQLGCSCHLALTRLFRFVVMLLAGTCITMSVYVMTFVWPTQVSAIYTTDPIKNGVYNFPAGFGTEVGALISALVMRKIGRTNLQLTAACFVLTLFVALQATLTSNSATPALGFYSIAGLANGFIQVLVIAMAQFTIPDRDIGNATGILITFRYVGAALGSKGFPCSSTSLPVIVN
jgi:hypothetical protein